MSVFDTGGSEFQDLEVPEEGQSAVELKYREPPTESLESRNSPSLTSPRRQVSDPPSLTSPRRQVSGGAGVGLAEDPEERIWSDEVIRANSDELEKQAKLLEQRVKQGKHLSRDSSSNGEKATGSKKSLLVETVLGSKHGDKEGGHHHKKKGAFAGVFVPTCENMWGVLIFLRFYFVVGQAGVMGALLCVLISFCAAFCTTSSMSAIVSSGGLVSKGGPYYMISRALGPVVGASVGIMYWLAITLLAVLETLGAVEALLMAAPSLDFPFCKQVYGSGFMLLLVLAVWGGINFVTKLGLFFVLIVFYTLASYYGGIISAPLTEEAMANPWVTGPSWETLSNNWGSHYDDKTSFGLVLSVFFPCFTGILSGANRADVLQDPPKNIKHGTFGAIIFSFFMYSSFFILWGSVADYRYLQGKEYHHEGNATDHHRRLASGAGEHLVTEIVYNPFPHSAHIGIIISSLSQALQCLIVAPRLLQSIARDHILTSLEKLAPLSKKGEPVRALFGTYVFAGLLVLLGEVNAVAPMLSMCFLVAYAFMNFSCAVLTYVRSPGFRPSGMGRKRWRMWYMCTGVCGSVVCVSIMLIINPFWAAGVLLVALLLYFYINYRLEQHEWGSAMDGIRFQLALTSLLQLEGAVQQAVNWRPQILILYRIHLSEELKGIKHHEILRFYSQFRKGNGFCVVACVLEAPKRDHHSLHKAAIEKSVIKSIMREEGIQGFAEVVVAPSWQEGTNYVIQLTGIGGLVPNTVLVDWPANWKMFKKKAIDFVNVISVALAAGKSVMAVKGLEEIPQVPVVGTIDIWWMIHDGGFMILLSWLLLQHKIWRQCHIRIFTITEGVSEDRAKNAAKLLTQTLRQRRLFDVDVEVIIADDEMISPYTYDWTLRVDQRHKFVEQLHGGKDRKGGIDAIPLEIDDLFKEADTQSEHSASGGRHPTKTVIGDSEGCAGSVAVSDLRRVKGEGQVAQHVHQMAGMADANEGLALQAMTGEAGMTPKGKDRSGSFGERPDVDTEEWDRVASFRKLNETILSRSKRAQLVVMNMPDIWSTEEQEVTKFMTYCDTMTNGLDRVLFVHSTGHEVFEIGG